MEVRQISNECIDDCTKMYMDVFSKKPWNEFWDYASANERLFTVFENPNFVGIGVFDENQDLIGFVVGFTEKWLELTNFYISEMCVSTDMQGKGVGSLLLSKLEDVCKKKDINRIELLTSRGGHAESFYKKNGYYTSGKVILMAKRLPKN
ncbi:GNAT family N-acetyltransferase [Aquibacillus rhizosphaerae]|uniref:GNAT family N-acetyltransferase n=1 Tax=Aquibacillus rhizosphaerae TaxID=3051431 RepID=A0ABT7L8K8_9BACI|nr:GNAT family N-acetyltransferase [Aquibacillus sp. LR5S19]MDL4842220.1 GNAT family N-acetyltransferase [Aquibacillus sp. LR5S19]